MFPPSVILIFLFIYFFYLIVLPQAAHPLWLHRPFFYQIGFFFQHIISFSLLLFTLLTQILVAEEFVKVFVKLVFTFTLIVTLTDYTGHTTVSSPPISSCLVTKNKHIELALAKVLCTDT